MKRISDLRFSDCRIHVWNDVLHGFLSSSVLVSSVQLPTSMINSGGTWDNAKKDISTSEHVPMVLTLHATCMRCGCEQRQPPRMKLFFFKSRTRLPPHTNRTQKNGRNFDH